MRDKIQSKKEKQPKFDMGKWMRDHDHFAKWWRDHRASGFCEDASGKYHWGIHPLEAWDCDSYRIEYSVYSGSVYKPRDPDRSADIDVDFSAWAAQQKLAEEFAEKRGFGYSAEENMRIWRTLGVGKGYLTAAVKDLLEAGFGANSMRKKIDEAYAPEPGQPEEETELLKRRRGD